MIVILFLLCLLKFPFQIDAQNPPRDETCDPEWFGRPENQDCKDALARLPDWDSMVQLRDEEWGFIREFVNLGAEPSIRGHDNHENNVRTPLILTNGGQNLARLSKAIMRADSIPRNLYSSCPF